jgi:hypothetical protein
MRKFGEYPININYNPPSQERASSEEVPEKERHS